MPLYRSPDGAIHERAEAFAHLLPPGTERLSEEEAAAVIAQLNTPTPEQLAARYEAFLTKVRELREKAINRLMGISVRMDRAGDTAGALACDNAVEELLDITANLPTDLQAAEATVVARWNAAALSLQTNAPTAVSAFMGPEL